MRTLIAVCAVAIAALLGGGCATPSIHPIYSSTDTPVNEPGLIGTWKDKDGRPTYTVTRAGDGYHMLVKGNDVKDPKQWEFSVRLVQIGEHRFADFAAVEEERDAHEEHWGPLFVPTHLFARLELKDDALTVWMLKGEWLERALADKTVALGHTRLDGHTLLITATTAELQEFLKKYGSDAGAFADKATLARVKP